MPEWVITRAPASPLCCTDSTSSNCESVETNALTSLAVAMMSMSLAESAIRRSEPAISTRSAAGWSRSAPAICSATGSARDKRIRGAGPPPSSWSARVRSRFSSTLAPKPRSLRISPCSAAARSDSSESIPSSS